MLNRWIQQAYLSPQKRSVLRRMFLMTRPFPFLYLRDFFVPEQLQRVRRSVLRLPLTERSCDLYQLRQGDDLAGVSDPLLREFYALFTSDEFCEYITSLTGISLTRHIDMSAALYTKTDYLLPHDDDLEGRKIAYVVNLSQQFTARDGGQLQFFSGKKHHPLRVSRSYVPQWNSLVLFRVAPGYYHQVHEVFSSKKRLALSGWLHG